MKTGARRSLIPAALQDIEAWPDIDVSQLDENGRRGVARKKEAIALYMAGYSFRDIAAQTLISDDNLRRIIKRCLVVAPDRRIFGFRALHPGLHVVAYTRTKPVVSNFVLGTSCSSGFAGALGQLFLRFPWLRKRVEKQFLGQNDNGEYVEARKSIANIHKEFFE
uniref:helix-turn-helix domain-containing protein n=1 Tax=Cupriavidus taiwanensis TaxID=164546 RepID=UPI003F490A75